MVNTNLSCGFIRARRPFSFKRSQQGLNWHGTERLRIKLTQSN